MQKIVKGGPFGLLENPTCCKISQIEGDSLLQYPHEEKTEKNPIFFRNFSWSPVSRIVPKNVKGGPFGSF